MTQFGNGLHEYSTYDAITGLLGSRTAGTSAQVQNLTYQWDKTGNLLQRKDLRLNPTLLAEDFYYDDLYRVKCSTLNVARQANCSALTAPQKNLDMVYDVLGNIMSKTGIGSYSYPTSGTQLCAASCRLRGRIHQLRLRQQRQHDHSGWFGHHVVFV